MNDYISAAYGLLQMLEKSPAQLEAEGRTYVREESKKVAQIVIECAQNGKRWEVLTDEEREIMTDYANIYRAACLARLKQLGEVEGTV